MSHLSLQAAQFGPLLGPIDLSIDSQGITAILGPNGAGKSLFLSLCHGMLDHQGEVFWDGQPAKHTRKRRGFMFQTTPVLRRSVRQNIRFAQIEPDAAHLKATVDLARLSDKADRPAATLSGGELQRMALARALINHPKAILLDEPSASLDPTARRDLEAMMQDLSQSGTKLFLATHDLGQAKRLAQDIVFLDNGQLCDYLPATSFFAGTGSRQSQTYLLDSA